LINLLKAYLLNLTASFTRLCRGLPAGTQPFQYSSGGGLLKSYELWLALGTLD